MSASVLLRAIQRAAQTRRFATLCALGLPAVLVFAALAWHLRLTFPLAWLAPALVLLLTLVFAWRSAQRLDQDWLARQLDARYPQLEDSSALLSVDPSTLPLLARLQQVRIAERLISLRPELSAPWPARQLIGVWSLCLLLASSVLWLWPERTAARPTSAAAPASASPDIPQALPGASLLIQPPTYTGLPERREQSLSTSLPQDARVHFALRLARTPSAVSLLFHDGSRLPLMRVQDSWRASRPFSTSTLYRIVVEPNAPELEAELYRLEVTPDRPPQIRVLSPERSLTLVEMGMRGWQLEFEASDDFGLGAAQLELSVASGSGENISVREEQLALRGTGVGKTRRYLRTLDLATLGLASGDDLIVRMTVRDNRQPQAQQSRSASFILRWPGETGSESAGMEGVVQRVLPAYFRSQRQIIIDSEALLAERPKPAAERYLRRSDAIGVDQRLLRMRYGQFLGEESESGQLEPGHSLDDGHDHGGSQALGSAVAVLEQYGHTHDHAEAATLLDPETRRLLKAALNEMWQAELHLRQGHPERSLPYQYRALALVKQVQQASRIYLARVGLELPPIEEARRMTGVREGIRPRALGLLPETPPDPLVQALWQKLGEPGPVPAAELEAFASWLTKPERASLPSALDLLAALDPLRRDPSCAPCALRLRGLLWPLLPIPASGSGLRPVGDAGARAYLRALDAEPAR